MGGGPCKPCGGRPRHPGRSLREENAKTTATPICTRTLAVKDGNQSAADLCTAPLDLNGTAVLRMRRSGDNLTLPWGCGQSI